MRPAPLQAGTGDGWGRLAGFSHVACVRFRRKGWGPEQLNWLWSSPRDWSPCSPLGVQRAQPGLVVELVTDPLEDFVPGLGGFGCRSVVCQHHCLDYTELYLGVKVDGLCHDVDVPVEKLTPQRRRQLTRKTLVEAAAEVFAQKGFYGASLEEIAEAAGFSRGAIYSNFGSKEELLLAVFDHYMDVQMAAVTGVMEAGGRSDPVRDAIAATSAWESVAPLTSSWPTLNLELRLSALRNPEVRKRLVEAERQRAERVARLIEEESARRGIKLRISSRDLADLSLAAVDGLAQLAAIDEEDAPHYRGLFEKLFIMFAETMLQSEDNHS